MQMHLTFGTQAFVASIALGVLVVVAPVGSPQTPTLLNSGSEIISPGIHDAEDLIFEREKLRRTTVTVKAGISCQSGTRCIMNLPAPLDAMIGVGLSALRPGDQKRIILAFANRDCFLKITGFFDGVQLEAHKVNFEAGSNCAQSPPATLTGEDHAKSNS